MTRLFSTLTLSDLRPVSEADLLGRATADIDEDEFEDELKLMAPPSETLPSFPDVPVEIPDDDDIEIQKLQASMTM